MKKILFLITIISLSTLTNAQQIITSQFNDDEKLFVKHVNLITKAQDEWKTVPTPLLNKAHNETVGSEGALINYSVLNEELKSMDLSQVIKEYPAFPERTILFVANLEKQTMYTGVLIDPFHVLIGGAYYYPLIDSPEKLAFTSLDGFKLLDDLGFASATDIYLFGSDSTDYQNNIALVTLSRPLGAIIGWMGFGAHTEESYYNQNTFYVTAFESHEEDDITFKKYIAQPDMILTNSFWFKPYKNFIPGAPFYNTNSAVHGMISHWGAVSVDGNKTTYDAATRITMEKYHTIASIIQNDKPDNADIMPLKLFVEPGIIDVSDEFNEFIFYLHNYSESAYTGNVTIDIYLSTDNIIETSDTKLKSYNTGDVTMNPLFAAHYVPTNKPKLPESLSPGLYFLGAIINSNDANTQNNTTPPAECAAVLVVNPNSSNYIAGKIKTNNDGPGEGYCMLFNHNGDRLNGVADIATVGTDLNFEFKNINDGSYNIAYIPQDSYNHRNIPTYYNNTPYWQDATVIGVSSSDTVDNIELTRIELPLHTGTKSISGVLTKSEEKSGSSLTDNFFDDITLILKNKSDQTINSFCSPTTAGNYTFENLNDGTYLISIDKPGFTQDKSTEVMITGETETISDINFTFYTDSTITATNVTNAAFHLKENANITIYPNPVNHYINVSFTSAPNIYSIELNNNSGQTVIQKQCTKQVEKLNIETLTGGIYYLKIYNDEFSKTEKIIIKQQVLWEPQ